MISLHAGPERAIFCPSSGAHETSGLARAFGMSANGAVAPAPKRKKQRFSSRPISWRAVQPLAFRERQRRQAQGRRGEHMLIAIVRAAAHTLQHFVVVIGFRRDLAANGGMIGRAQALLGSEHVVGRDEIG